MSSRVAWLRTAVRRRIPRPWLLRIIRLWPTLSRLGWRIQCPCCGIPFRTLETFRGRPNGRCPWCWSGERHRLMALYLRERTVFLTEPLSLLHVAPEESVQRVLRRAKQLRYVSIDLRHPQAEMRMDLTELRFPDDHFDGILCSHVLEHIVDDRKAMSELRRVLKPAGVALIAVPQDLTKETTLEDPTITSRADRLRVFKHEDHVRIYGADFMDRLEAAGLATKLDRFGETLPESVRRRHAIRYEPIYRATKRAAASAAAQSASAETRDLAAARPAS
jgi:SAM-dependent methyltransferase